MAQTTKKSFDQPDEVRTMPKASMAIVKMGDIVYGKGVIEPGWKWSECVKPIVQTESCQVHHKGFIVSGRMHIKMDDGSEVELVAGDVMDCPPGHDAWVVGDEPCVAYDIAGAVNYAKPA